MTCDRQETPKSNKGKKQTKEKKREENKKDKDEKLTEKKEKDLSHVDCYACGEAGHYASQCPTRKKANDEESEERSAHLT
jgi:hypothetical protein